MKMERDSRQQAILDEFRDFVRKEIKPYATELDAEGKYPTRLIKKLAARKYLTPTFPQQYGGLALDPIHYGQFIEEIGKACSNTRTLISIQTSIIGETILRWGTESQKKHWLAAIASGEKIAAFALTEPEIGSDARNVQSSYSKRGNEFVINGRKKWISFGGLADFFIVVAHNEAGISAFIVEKERKGIKTIRIKGMMAGRAAHIAEIELRNVQIPQANLLGNEGGGFSFVVNTSLDHGRYSVAWAGIGLAQAGIEAMVRYARTRTQFGKKIHNFQLIQGIIGDAVTSVHAARALCLNAGRMRIAKNPDAISETMIAKYFASRVAVRVASDTIQVHGGDGFCSAYPAERIYREAKVLEIIEGTTQIHQEFIAKYGLRKYHEKRID